MRLNIKKKPLLLVTLVTFWFGYSGLRLYQYIDETNRLTTEENLRRMKVVDYLTYTATPLLVEGQVEELRQNLKEAEGLRMFDHYLLKRGEEVVAWYNPGKTLEETNRSQFVLGWSKTEDFDFQAKTIRGGDYLLMVGINMYGADLAADWIAYEWRSLLMEFTVVTIFLGILLYLILRDIIDLSRVLGSRDRHKASLIKVRTREAETLLTVASQFERVTESLKLANQTFAESLSPAVRHELKENTPVPTVFDVVVVRIDVNGYTQMFLERKVEFVAATMNRYFQQASELIARYGGHVYQYVGDEIVCHFKLAEKSQEGEALLRALACVRGLFEVAQNMDQELKPEGVPFVVKAAMVRGKLRFIQLDTGYAFAGLPLIESVRMMGKIDDKQENILALYAEEASQLTALAQVWRRLKVEFKGFSGQTEICEIKAFTPVAEVLQSKDYAQLVYYRSDRDMSEIFTSLRENLKAVEKAHLQTVFRALRGYPVERLGGEAAARFSELFLAAGSWAEEGSEVSVYVLASLTSLAGHLLRAGAIDERLRQVMEKNLEHSDQRVRGNTVLALDELSPETYSFREMFALPFNRAAADALTAEGKRDYSEEIHRFLKSFLESEDPFFTASALYVMSYLYRYHRERDPVYFGANRSLQGIPDLILHYGESENSMVRRRAEISRAMIDPLEMPR